MINRAKLIIAHSIAEKMTLDHTDKMYLKNIVQTIIDAMKIKGVDYKLKKRLEDSYHYLSKVLVGAGDKPFQLGQGNQEL